MTGTKWTILVETTGLGQLVLLNRRRLSPSSSLTVLPYMGKILQPLTIASFPAVIYGALRLAKDL
jgi:hypothetical protein